MRIKSKQYCADSLLIVASLPSHSPYYIDCFSAHHKCGHLKFIKDGTAPTAPGNLSVTVKRKSQVAVSWNASTDSGSGFDHYIVKRNGATITTTTRTSFTDKPGSGTFIYTVDAFDKAGNAQGNSTSIIVGGSSGGGSKGKGRKK